MTRRTRNVIFSILFILFLIVAPLTVFYSLGWRFDWKTKELYQTGIFYFKISPKSADIYINGEFKEKTDFFFGSTLIESLTPAEYIVEVKKPGYHNWKKTLAINKKDVTEAKNITLVPKDPEFNILTEGVKEFFFSPNNENIILKEESLTKDEKKIWNLKLFEIKNDLKSHLISEKDISSKGATLLNLEFSPNSKKVLLTIGVKEIIRYYILDIDSPTSFNHLDFLDPAEEISFHPKDPQKLFVLLSLKDGATTLNEVNFINEEILPPALEDIITYSATNNNIYYLDKTGSVFYSDLSFDKKEKLNIIPFDVKEETEYQVIAYNSYLFLKENNNLYIFNETKKEFEKFFDSIKDYQVSSDGKRMTYFNNHEISVLFLEKQYDHPTKEKGEQLFITRFSEEIDNVFWYTNHYLIFNAGDEIKVAETDNRNKINIVDLAKYKDPEIFWANKKLYFLSEENLYVSKELTP